MNDITPEVDPLSTYEFPTYNYINIQGNGYPYDVKAEPSNQTYTDLKTNTNPCVTNLFKNLDINLPEKTEDKSKEIKPKIENKVKKEKEGKKSNYLSEKINEAGYPFYACSVCDISYAVLHDLDVHVCTHEGRITSYDLKIKNQIKRKQLKKERKRLKKLKNVKIENEVEIKPEDGYIGNEKASDFLNNGNGEKKEQSAESDVKNCTDNLHKNKNDSEEKKNLEKIYKCYACKKQFSLSYYLKLHVRSHTDEKPYTCSVCGQSFITASKLGRHNKRIHLAIRSQCRICFKYFTKFEGLTRHFDKKHADEKLEGEPYDYNAILPYLKELEEQLREQNEAKDAKPNTEELWPDAWSNADQSQAQDEGKATQDIEPLVHFDVDVIKPEEVNLGMDEVEVKVESLEADVDNENAEECFDDDVKDESLSDDDYFPSNTWAATPKIEHYPPSPTPKKRGKSDPLKCDICEKTISSAAYMKIHLRTHTGEKPFKCYICNRGFITGSKMHRHVLTHAETWGGGEGQIKAEDVDVKAEPEQDGDKTKDKEEIIKKAKEKFTKKPKKNATEKQKKMYKKRPHACEYCQKRFLHIETLHVHRKSHEGEEKVHKCYYCLVNLADEEALKVHEATHKGPKPFLCTLCGKSYIRRETMVYHRKHHKPEKKYICDMCSKTFSAPCKLQRHLVSHRADRFVLRYECPVCAHMFNTRYHVHMHLATHQKEGLILEENRNAILAMVLQNARKIPKQPDAPNNLTDLIPSDERSRICNICGEVFQHFYYLEEHLKSHGSKIAIEDITKVEEKKHVCPICNKSFKLHYYLKLHSFTHSKEKPYICQQCGKGFITRGKLKRHLETHSGLKKYQCHICYKYFTRPSYLRIHVRTIHGNQDYNFRIGKEFGLAPWNFSVVGQNG